MALAAAATGGLMYAGDGDAGKGVIEAEKAVALEYAVFKSNNPQAAAGLEATASLLGMPVAGYYHMINYGLMASTNAEHSIPSLARPFADAYSSMSPENQAMVSPPAYALGVGEGLALVSSGVRASYQAGLRSSLGEIDFSLNTSYAPSNQFSPIYTGDIVGA